MNFEYNSIMSRGKVLYLTINRHPDGLRKIIKSCLSNAGLDYETISYEDLGSLQTANLGKFDAVLLAPARRIHPEILRGLSRSKLLQIWSSGYDKFNLSQAKSFGHNVANNGGSNGQSVAEHTINLMLGVSRRNIEMHNRVISGAWEGNDHGLTSRSLMGKTLGIIGFGNIGQKVATLATAFGMNIIFFDTNENLKAHPKSRSMDEILLESDYISLHIHLNDSTNCMISIQEFSKMLKKPFIINVSRAELIEKQALVTAMKNELISGCALDVHYNEPNKPDEELYQFRNVLFSPHIAGSTLDIYHEAVNFCVKNVCTALEGGPIESLL
jgi:phosphoglycerate dehydrogenase-like enzyme